MFGGVQLAINTTLVSGLRCDGSALPRCANVDGAALQGARRRKERAYQELAGPARLVVLAGEVAGRWSEETRDFLNQLARGSHEPAVLKRRVQQHEVAGHFVLQCLQGFRSVVARVAWRLRCGR